VDIQINYEAMSKRNCKCVCDIDIWQIFKFYIIKQNSKSYN